jgi:hypothetical protein
MDLARLKELKRKLLLDQQLAPVWTFFLDHFAEKPGFIALGERARHPLVEAVLVQVGQQLFGADGTISDMILTRIADQQFLHGGFRMGGRFGGVFYFEDAHSGLVAVADHPPGNEGKYARFSGRPVPRHAGPSLN